MVRWNVRSDLIMRAGIYIEMGCLHTLLQESSVLLARKWLIFCLSFCLYSCTDFSRGWPFLFSDIYLIFGEIFLYEKLMKNYIICLLFAYSIGQMVPHILWNTICCNNFQHKYGGRTESSSHFKPLHVELMPTTFWGSKSYPINGPTPVFIRMHDSDWLEIVTKVLTTCGVNFELCWQLN